MSYPNQNPYSQPPAPQPGYGFPAQQPGAYGPYQGGGMPPGMPPGGIPQPPLTGMPGGVKAARVLLFVLAGMNLIGLCLAVAGLGAVSRAARTAMGQSRDTTAVGKGLLIFLIVVIAIFTVLAVVLALQFANGGNGVRVGAAVFGAATLVVSFCVFPFGLIHTVMGILIIAFTSKEDGKAWFNRPRY